MYRKFDTSETLHLEWLELKRPIQFPSSYKLVPNYNYIDCQPLHDINWFLQQSPLAVDIWSICVFVQDRNIFSKNLQGSFKQTTFKLVKNTIQS